MRIRPGWEKVRQHAVQHGLAKTAHRVSYAMLKHWMHYLNMRCICAARDEIRGPDTDEARRLQGYVARFLNDAEALIAAQRPECKRAGMTEDFARAALGDDHKCMAVLDGEFVAHFSWYSRKSPTRINDDWNMHFDEACVYIYFVYTDPRYRGQKLLPFAVKQAVLESGAALALAFVESANFSSLQSFYKMGFRDFAKIQVARFFGKPLMRHGAGSERFGFRVADNMSREQANRRAAAVQD